MGSDWRKFIYISVAILLVNEFIVGLIIDWKNNPSRDTSDPGVLPTIDDHKASDVANVNRQVDEKSPVVVPPSDSISVGDSASKRLRTQDVRPQNANKPNQAAAAFKLSTNASDVDQLKDACISYDNISKTHSISYRGVYGSWMGRTKNRNDQESFHLASRKNPWLRTSHVPYDTLNTTTIASTSPSSARA